MDPLALILLAVASFLSGAVNAVAGGGTLIAFPALIAYGLSPLVANVTSKVAIWPGTVGGSLAYRSEIRDRKRRVVLLAIPSVLGAVAGSVLLLATSQQLFNAIVPFLVIFASVLLAVDRPLSRIAVRAGMAATSTERIPPALYIAMFFVGTYGGYFGAGLGILILSAMSILAPDDIQHANAVKGILAMVNNFVAILVFSVFGPVQWLEAGVMAVFAIVGGYLGVGLARRLPAARLRMLIVAWGLIVGFKLLLFP
jgi:uncharacterized membrane protein YfcA